MCFLTGEAAMGVGYMSLLIDNRNTCNFNNR